MMNLGRLLLKRRKSSDSARTYDTASVSSDVSTFTDLTNHRSSIYLNQLIFDGCWEEATSLVRANGRHSMKERKVHQFNGNQFATSLLPIHLACANPTVTLDFIEVLLFSNPASIKARESQFKRTCLHVALRCGLKDEIIFHLVEKFPEGLKIQDKFGRIPLHYAISNHRSSALISDFISRFPNTIHAADQLGWSALHIAISQGSPISIIEMIISESIEVITLTTEVGATPLHHALMSKDRNSKVIIDILSKAETALCKQPAVANFREAQMKEKQILGTMAGTVFV
jgi:ankyrin repeat protein